MFDVFPAGLGEVDGVEHVGHGWRGWRGCGLRTGGVLKF